MPDNDLTSAITYNWQVSFNNGKTWATVQSGTSNTYTTTETNEGGLLRVSISTTDTAGNPVTGTSASALVNDPPPTLTIPITSLNVNAGGSVALPITVAGFDPDDTVSVNISGLPKYEQITDNLDNKTFTGKSITLTAAEVNSGLTLTSTYKGTGQPVATLTVTALNTTAGETSKSAPQTITVTDPPLATSGTTATLDSIAQRSDAGLVTLPAQAGYRSVDAFNNLPPGIDATSFVLLGKPDPHSGAADQVNSPATAGLNPSLLLQSMASFGANGAPGGTFSSLADNLLNAAQNVVTVDPHHH